MGSLDSGLIGPLTPADHQSGWTSGERGGGGQTKEDELGWEKERGGVSLESKKERRASDCWDRTVGRTVRAGRGPSHAGVGEGDGDGDTEYSVGIPTL